MRQTITNSRKGQAQFLMGIVVLFAALAILSVLMSPMLTFISLGVNATNGTTNGSIIATLYQLIPLLLVLVFLIIIFKLASG